jgi:hypothetical protein
MTEDAAESINVHSIHQAALCKIVSEAMGRNAFVQTYAPQIAFEIRLKVADLDVCARVTSGGEQIISGHIAVLILHPAAQNLFCLTRKIHHSVFAPLCDFSPKRYLPIGKAYIIHEQAGAFPKSHAAVNHQHNHSKVPMLREIGFIQTGNQLLEIFIADILLCLPVNFELTDFFHGILFRDSLNVKPVKKYTHVADIVVYGYGADGLAVIAPSFREVCLLLVIVAVKRVFTALL